MSLYDEKERRDYVKNLANQLNAKYYSDIESVMKKFNLNDIDCKNDSNFIVGNYKGCSYCFLEYYVSGKGSQWFSKLIIKVNENIPDFQMITKSNAIKNGCLGFIISFFVIGIPIMMVKQNPNLTNIQYLPILFFICLTFCFVFWGIYYWGITINPGRYKIGNRRFKKKYTVFDFTELDKIKIIFNREVCNKIIDFKEDLNISLMSKKLIYNFSYDKQLSYDECNKYLNNFVDIVKTMENAIITKSKMKTQKNNKNQI